MFKVLVLGFFSHCAWGNLPKLAKEFIRKNSTVLRAQTDALIERHQVDFLRAGKQWSLNYQTSYVDGRLESAFPMPGPERRVSHMIGVDKQFPWGAKVSLGNGFYRETGGKGDVYSLFQSVGYSQDLGKNFFGRSFYRELDVAQGSWRLAEKTSRKVLRSGLLRLSKSYSNAKRQKSIVKLQREAKGRAQSRLALIKKWVRDGLREKVDLYRAQIALHGQEEQLSSAQVGLHDFVEELGQALHRRVDEAEIGLYDFDRLASHPHPGGDWEGNDDLALFAQKESFLKAQLAKAGYALVPEINVMAQYKSRGLAKNRSEATSRGLLGKRPGEASVSLSLNWPIGSHPQRIQRAKHRADLLTTQAQKKKLRESLVQSHANLKNKLSLLDKNIKSVNARKRLANASLREFNRLYRQGNAELDQVIRAEEDLINTEKSFARYLAQRDHIIFELTYSYGKIKEFLLGEALK